MRADQPTFEKKTANLFIQCKPSEKLLWATAFGFGEMSRKARELLNAAAKSELRHARNVKVISR